MRIDADGRAYTVGGIRAPHEDRVRQKPDDGWHPMPAEIAGTGLAENGRYFDLWHRQGYRMPDMLYVPEVRQLAGLPRAGFVDRHGTLHMPEKFSFWRSPPPAPGETKLGPIGDAARTHNAALDAAIEAVGNPDKKGREWVMSSLWSDLVRESTGRIEALKVKP